MIIDFILEHCWTIILILIVLYTFSVDRKVEKLETRLEKLEPESENNKKPKNWFQRLLKWW